MNERIKKLKDQCWEERRWNNDMWIEKHIDLEKFAELIVKECSNVCSDVGVAIFAEPVQNNFGTAQTCKLAIKKHLLLSTLLTVRCFFVSDAKLTHVT